MNLMQSLIAGFPQHLTHALEIGANFKLGGVPKRYDQVVITGLGGSGIGGSLVAEVCAATAQYPILINKGYTLPAFVDANTLVIACSYSGNTEETLMALEMALQAGAEVAIITSGGKALQIAQQHHLNHIVIPGGNPPRSMLGYSVVQLFVILEAYGIQVPDFRAQIGSAVSRMTNEMQQIHQLAQEVADVVKHKTVVTYACDGMGALATRFRQQFNENAKMVGWDAAIPEMNHNELVGWAGGSDALAVVMLRSNLEHPRNAKRAEINTAFLEEKTPHVITLWGQGESLLEQSLYLNHVGDWATFYLSEIHGVDILDIQVIDYLKDALSKF